MASLQYDKSEVNLLAASICNVLLNAEILYFGGAFMLDKVGYWLDLANDDVSVAELLLKGGKYLQAGFFCHLIAEKALKAVVVNVTNETPPKMHDLIKLAVRGGIFDDLSENHLNLLEELNPLSIEARYPDYKANIASILTASKCENIFKETEGFLCWIRQKLEK